MERSWSLGSLGSFGIAEPLQVGGMLRFPSLGGAEFQLPDAQPVTYEDFDELFVNPQETVAVKAPEPAQKAVKAAKAPKKAPKAKQAPKEVPADFVLLPFQFKAGIDQIDKSLIESKLREIEFATKRRDEAKAKFARIKAGEMYRNKSASVRKGLEDRFQGIVKTENKRCEALLRSAMMYQAYVD